MFKFIKIFISTVIFFLLIEILCRCLLFYFTNDIKSLIYGYKNIKLVSHSFSKLEFFIYDEKSDLKNKMEQNNLKNNLYTNNSLNKNISKIWVFGGSTSNKGFCDDPDSSWLDYLNMKNVNITNFSRNGVYSTFSLGLLKSKLSDKNKPDTIFWTNKINEIRFSNDYQTKIFFFKTLKKSLKEKFVFIYFYDETIIRILDKLKIRKISFVPDYNLAAENYYLNTKKALILAKNYGISNFYIISLFNESNILNIESIFDKFYLDKIKILKKEYNFIFIQTDKFLKKNYSGKLFCDSMHQTKLGKIITAKIVEDKL